MGSCVAPTPPISTRNWARAAQGAATRVPVADARVKKRRRVVEAAKPGVWLKSLMPQF